MAQLKILCVKLKQQRRRVRGCRSVELRALCDEVPRTPPGPEGSNGTGITSCAAEYPKFLSSAACRFLRCDPVELHAVSSDFCSPPLPRRGFMTDSCNNIKK